MNTRSERLAVVLLNLGGPENQAGVRPFLQSLFSDPEILPYPAVVRAPLATLIARLRLDSAKANYAVMGGGSPLLAGTKAQAKALEAALIEQLAPATVKVFIAMRHAPPSSATAAAEVAGFSPDQVVLTPLYPQYSTTTTGSSLAAWRRAYKGPGASRAICCWYENVGLIEAHAALIEQTWEAAGRPPVRLLLSAHGLPLSVIGRGDPYQWQVEATCARLVARLGPHWDWRICYQSRVGPMPWLRPTTIEAIGEAGADGKGVIIDPIAFVSEHVETLVELDRDYRRLAEGLGVVPYLRVPALGCADGLIDGLAEAVGRSLGRSADGPDGGPCDPGLARCGHRPA